MLISSPQTTRIFLNRIELACPYRSLWLSKARCQYEIFHRSKRLVHAQHWLWEMISMIKRKSSEGKCQSINCKPNKANKYEGQSFLSLILFFFCATIDGLAHGSMKKKSFDSSYLNIWTTLHVTLKIKGVNSRKTSISSSSKACFNRPS